MSRYCSQCGKAKKACICQWIESLASDVELIILQHPSEELRPLGTARILDLSLESCQLLIGEDFSTHSLLNQLLADDRYQHWLLFPSEQAVEVEEVARSLTANGKVPRIILLDGTWKKAYKMWQVSENLQGLPCVKLPQGLSGNYRIRKSPSENALSTVEAGFHILRYLQPQGDFSALITAFDKMIEFQIAQMPPGVFEQNYLDKS
ncbi:DTW domain-containing protein [Vibrio sp. IRLE0018]|uniref:tRNA-uridine aminocarboxypropyltransferase n=1 Tax=Vibrio TaxID=662 RepID=UPI001594877D|nr:MULTISPECIES: DTW domain-containing protein [Vibrio]MCF8778453.1 DTW domain-containing protein [Vibrio floridensis]NVC62207.1 DTW domain-containing protein [Vibrio sp. 05-20-BW147]HAS6347800.1 DTW domain-containing protein [Vibrio vulnificus]